MREFIRLQSLGAALRCVFSVGLPILMASPGAESVARSNEPEVVKIAYFKGVSNAVFFQAERSGYFKEQGLNVQLILGPTGTAGVAAVTHGAADLASAGMAPVLVELARGTPLEMVAGINLESPSNIMIHLVASKRSGVRRIADLKGKTILAANLDGLCELAWRDWLAHGSVKWEEVRVLRDPFSRAQGLLEVGDADAACLPEPFYTALRLSTPDLVDLASGLLVDQSRPYALATLVSTRSWLSNHPDAVFRLRIALSKAVDDLRRDPLAYRQLLVSEFGIPANVADHLSPAPALFTPLKRAHVLPIVEAMQRTHMLGTEFSIGNAIAVP